MSPPPSMHASPHPRVDDMPLAGCVLVTGANGFVGRHLVARLLSTGVAPRILLRPGRDVPPAWAGRVAVSRGELGDRASLAAACRGVETVFHAGGFAHADATPENARVHERVNAVGTSELVSEAVAAGVGRFVYFSSVKAMGDPGRRCVDEDWPEPPVTPYGRAKRRAEAAVLGSAVHGVNLRLAMVYGPGGRGNLERLIAAERRGWMPILPEVGNRRSMVHVEDVVQAALLAATSSAARGRTYIVTDGESYSTREVQALVRRALGRPPGRMAVPAGLLAIAARAGDLVARVRGCSPGFDGEALERLLGWACFSCDRIRRELGYRPRWTLAAALAAMVTPGTGEGHGRARAVR